MPEPTTGRTIPRPSLDDFVFEGERLPWLLRRNVVIGIGVGFVVLIAAYFAAAEILGISWNIDAKPFQEWVDGFGIWGPIVFVAAMALSVLFAPIPNAPILITAGLVWGPVLGTAYSMAGLLIGSAMAFHISRWLGRRFLPRLIGAKAAQRLDQVAETIGGRLIFWLRMLPAVNFDWISFAAGMTSIRFVVFIVFSALGMLLPTSVTVIAGDGLGRDPRITLAAIACWVVGILASASFFWYRRRRWQASRNKDRVRSAEHQAEFGTFK